MTPSRNSILFALLSGTEDDPTPHLHAAVAQAKADGDPNAENAIRDALNAFIDAEVTLRLIVSEPTVVTESAADAFARHGRAIETCRALLRTNLQGQPA